MRLAERIAKVIVEAAEAGITPVHNLSECQAPLVVTGQLSDFRKPTFQPYAVVQRRVKVIEIITASAHSTVTLDAELHPDALEQSLAELKEPGAQIGGDWLSDSLVENFLRGEHRRFRSGSAKALIRARCEMR